MPKHDTPEAAMRIAPQIDNVEALLNLGVFLYYYRLAHPSVMWGGRKIGEAMDAYHKLTGITPAGLKKVIEGE